MAEKFDPVAWAKDLAKAMIPGGEVKKALDETNSGLAAFKKEGDPNAYFRGLDKIAKIAVPNEKKKVKPDAQKELEELKKAAETERKTAEKAMFTIGKEEKGSPV